MSVCTNHVQQKQGLIHLIYTMHRALFTWDIPTEGFCLVLLAFQTGQREPTDLFSLSYANEMKKGTNIGTICNKTKARNYLLQRAWFHFWRASASSTYCFVSPVYTRFIKPLLPEINHSRFRFCSSMCVRKVGYRLVIRLCNRFILEKESELLIYVYSATIYPVITRLDSGQYHTTKVLCLGLSAKTSCLTQLSKQHRIKD